MKIVHISDTHSTYLDLPEGDILVHTGDYSFLRKHSSLDVQLAELKRFNDWLGTLKFKHIIFVPGNHDFIFEKNPNLAKSFLLNAKVLIDEEIVINGKLFYGTPSQPPFCNWAFNDPDSVRMQKFLNIPSNTDVLLTHCPPYETLDILSNYGSEPGVHIGCMILATRINALKLQAHLFGHIHEGYGMITKNRCQYSNGSVLDERYRGSNKPNVLEIE